MTGPSSARDMLKVISEMSARNSPSLPGNKNPINETTSNHNKTREPVNPLPSNADMAKGTAMIVVLFEVTVKKECMNDYLALAAALRSQLANADGFLRSERFSSLSHDGKLLSLSVWENERAVEKWRNETTHRMSQQQGHESLFESYTITVASKLRVYSNSERSEAPEDSFFSGEQTAG